MDSDYSKEEVDSFKKIIQHVDGFINKKITPVIEKYIINQLDYSMRLFMNFTKKYEGLAVERLSINRDNCGKNKLLENISQIKYPPKERVKNYGRCNLKNQSVFYGGFHFMAILTEMRPKIGELVTRTEWRQKPGETLNTYLIFRKQPDFDKYAIPRRDVINEMSFECNIEFEKFISKQPPNKRDFSIFIADYLADVFSRKIDSTNNANYLMSAYFADFILNKTPENIDAILYPSFSQRLREHNIVIKKESFKKKFDLYELHDSYVTSPNFFLGIGQTKSFDFASGKIIREEKYGEAMSSEIFKMKLLHNSDADITIPKII